MGYKIDLHLHSKENSKCAPAPGVDIARAYKEAGFDGIVLTNHFFTSYRRDFTVPEWEEAVDYFFTGYNNAKEYGDGNGLDVFFAWEYNFRGADLLTYGLGREWLMDNPCFHEWSIGKYAEEVHKAGGFITHAHPFREAGPSMEFIQLFPRLVDAVEIYNGSHEASCYGPHRLDWNVLAKQYAENFGLLKTAGSDTHGCRRVDGHLAPYRPGAMVFDGKFGSVGEMIGMLREKKYALDCPTLFWEEKPEIRLENFDLSV